MTFEDVSFSYAAPRRGLFGRRRAATGPWALRHASFEVPDGTLCALIGHTGSGKSTAVELACGLKLPCEGRVLVNGADTASAARSGELRRLVGYVSQAPERQLFARTVADDVCFGPKNLGLSAEEASERAARALRLAGLDPETVWDASPFALSGGQQRSAALAGVLAMEPRVLVLDEPMAGLDPSGRDRLEGLLRELRGRGVTIVLVTHSMDDVARLADGAVVLDRGQVAAQGTPREVFADAAFMRRVGLGVPGPLLVARKLRERGVDLGCEPLTEEELRAAVLRRAGIRARRETDRASGRPLDEKAVGAGKEATARGI